MTTPDASLLLPSQRPGARSAELELIMGQPPGYRRGASWLKYALDPVFLWAHDSSEPIAVVCALSVNARPVRSEDSAALYYITHAILFWIIAILPHDGDESQRLTWLYRRKMTLTKGMISLSLNAGNPRFSRSSNIW